MSQPWKTDQWFVSPWNYAEDVRSQLNFPENIRIHDVTLRDGEQQTGIVFRRQEKVAIAKKLTEAGVHRIEAGMPAVSAEDEAAIKDIVALDLGPEIFSFARCMPADVKLAKECGVHGIITEIPSSEHIIRNAYGKTMDWAVKSSIETTLAAKEAGLYTVFFTIDSTRSDLEALMDLIEKVSTEGHMDSMTLADSFGGCTPEAVGMVVKKFRARFQQPIEIHCHEDFGLGVANTIAALANGASVAHVTVTGTGERAGNVPLEDTVMALRALYGVDLGIKTETFYELSKLVQELAGFQVPPQSADRRRLALQHRIGHREHVPSPLQGRGTSRIHPLCSRDGRTSWRRSRTRQGERVGERRGAPREKRPRGDTRRGQRNREPRQAAVDREKSPAHRRGVQLDR